MSVLVGPRFLRDPVRRLALPKERGRGTRTLVRISHESRMDDSSLEAEDWREHCILCEYGPGGCHPPPRALSQAEGGSQLDCAWPFKQSMRGWSTDRDSFLKSYARMHCGGIAVQATTLAFASCYIMSATLPCHIRAVSHHLSIGQAMAGSIRSKALSPIVRIILVGRIESHMWCS